MTFKAAKELVGKDADLRHLLRKMRPNPKTEKQKRRERIKNRKAKNGI